MRVKTAFFIVFALCVAGVSARAQSVPGPDEPVVALSFRGMHRAYTLSLLSARRVVNDVVGNQEVVVFHDPARDLTTAWFRQVLGEPIEFSTTVSGVVAEDITTVTRWDLERGESIGGNLVGRKLIPLPVQRTLWGKWLATHPTAAAYADGEP